MTVRRKCNVKTPKKIDAMHELFGACSGRKCKECPNFIKFRYHDVMLRKCNAYGLTHSEASDWAGKWEACGLFGKEYVGRPIMQTLARSKSAAPEIDGQLDIFNELE